MIRKLMLVAVVSVGLGLQTSASRANDTELTYGGTPRPLNGNTTVAMKSEYVKMVVGDKWVTVDCQFTFENRGPARKVRMGFPDEGGEPDEGPDGKPLPPQGTFASFESWVNGKPVKTTVIKAADPGDVWHVKTVDFPADSTLRVRDRYTVEVGNSVAYFPVSVHLARYVLHTGSSWRGPLGRSEIEVVFTRKSVRSPIVTKPMPKIDGRGPAAVTWSDDKRTVYFAGPCPPTVSGKTLRFVRTDWRPTAKDDIFLLFDLTHPKANAIR
jgi:hypothetical protein